jgi:sulfide-dependent adenosine diphosphate thiazole synthase
MAINEIDVTRGILEGFSHDFIESLDLDVAVAGAGPSGITAAYYLAREGLKVSVFERNLYVGGGIWGGGMLFPRIVVQTEASDILSDMGLSLEPNSDGYLVGDPVEVVARCTAAAIEAGARIWVGLSVEDLMIREQNRVAGVVLNWRAVELSGMHVDPLAVRSKAVIDATGHDCNVVRTLLRKVPGVSLSTPSGGVAGEMSMWAESGERLLVENTGEVHPGLMVAGMAVNAAYGSPRMGAVFGGMFRSGRKVATQTARMLEG